MSDGQPSIARLHAQSGRVFTVNPAQYAARLNAEGSFAMHIFFPDLANQRNIASLLLPRRYSTILRRRQERAMREMVRPTAPRQKVTPLLLRVFARCLAYHLLRNVPR